MHVTPLSPDTPNDQFKTLYAQFAERAVTDYCWPSPPLPYESVLRHIDLGLMNVLGLYDGDDLQAFWLCIFPGHYALELCVFFVEDPTSLNDAQTRDAFDLALTYWQTLPDWEAFSFGCYGAQNPTAQALIGHADFHAADQHILQRTIVGDDAHFLTAERMKPPFPYTIHPMKPKWVKGLATSLAAAFCDEPDALWDPRFRDTLGATLLLEQILGGAFGHYHDPFSFVLVDERRKPVPIGAIFALQVEERVLNIPLLFMDPQHRGKGLATSLMHHLLKTLLPNAQKVSGPPLMINATTNPEQVGARNIYNAYHFTLHEAGHHVYMSTPKTKSPLLG
jgi:GNAT superfamily N-acetyltransferase